MSLSYKGWHKRSYAITEGRRRRLVASALPLLPALGLFAAVAPEVSAGPVTARTTTEEAVTPMAHKDERLRNRACTEIGQTVEAAGAGSDNRPS
jgi:hypothetical protein